MLLIKLAFQKCVNTVATHARVKRSSSGVIPTGVEFDSPVVPPRHADEGRHPRLLLVNKDMDGASSRTMTMQGPSAVRQRRLVLDARWLT